MSLEDISRREFLKSTVGGVLRGALVFSITTSNVERDSEMHSLRLNQINNSFKNSKLEVKDFAEYIFQRALELNPDPKHPTIKQSSFMGFVLGDALLVYPTATSSKIQHLPKI